MKDEYPVWIGKIKEIISNKLDERGDALEWDRQFGSKMKTITDWEIARKKFNILMLELALPFDTSDRKVVKEILDLYKRSVVSGEEWEAARDFDLVAEQYNSAEYATMIAWCSASSAAHRGFAVECELVASKCSPKNSKRAAELAIEHNKIAEEYISKVVELSNIIAGPSTILAAFRKLGTDH